MRIAWSPSTHLKKRVFGLDWEDCATRTNPLHTIRYHPHIISLSSLVVSEVSTCRTAHIIGDHQRVILPIHRGVFRKPRPPPPPRARARIPIDGIVVVPSSPSSWSQSSRSPSSYSYRGPSFHPAPYPWNQSSTRVRTSG